MSTTWVEEVPVRGDGCIDMKGYGLDDYGVSKYGAPNELDCYNFWTELEMDLATTIGE